MEFHQKPNKKPKMSELKKFSSKVDKSVDFLTNQTNLWTNSIKAACIPVKFSLNRVVI